MNDKKFWLIISAVSGFTAVAIGAFGAHGLREKLSAEMLEVYKTGVFYQFIHTVVLSLTNFIQARIASFFFRNHIFLIFTLYLLNIRNSIFCNDHANRWSMFSDRMAFANY